MKARRIDASAVSDTQHRLTNKIDAEAYCWLPAGSDEDGHMSSKSDDRDPVYPVSILIFGVVNNQLVADFRLIATYDTPFKRIEVMNGL